MKKVFLWALGVLFCAAICEAKTIYVATAPLGSDAGTGTTRCTRATSPTTPLLTIQIGVACLVGGDTLQIAAGSYTPSQQINGIPGGSSAGRTIIRGAGKDITILLGSPGSEPGHFFVTNNWTEIRDMTLDGQLEAGVGVQVGSTGNGVTQTVIRNMGIHTQRNTGIIQSALSTFSLIENVEIYNMGEGEPFDTPGKHGVYLHSGTGHIVRGCYFHDNDKGYGMQLWEPPTNAVVENNIFENNESGLFVGGSNHMIRNNVFINNGNYPHLNGYALVYQGGATGATAGIYNNTFYGNNDAIAGSSGATSANIRNNIFFNTGTPVGGVPGGMQSPNLLTDPSFVNAAAGNLCILEGSAARNMGATLTQVLTDIRGTARPQPPGGAYDMGAYEYPCTGVIAPPPITPSVALSTTHTCATPSNVLNAQVIGSMFYLPAGAASNSTALVDSHCASNVQLEDVASIVTGGFPSTRPFNFDGIPGPNVANTCTNCMSVHAGTISNNASGSGFTLDTFRQANSVASATGGTHTMALLPGLCTRVVAGAVTNEPLWPGGQWSMNQRILDARMMAGKPSINVTAAVQGLLGTIPVECTITSTECIPPLVGTPPNCDCPPGTLPPNCTPVVITHTIFYISETDGDDASTCTFEEPCATFQRARSLGSAGAKYIFRGGNYTGPGNRINTAVNPIVGGTSASNPTIITSYESESVTFEQSTGIIMDFTNPTTDHFITLNNFAVNGLSTPTNNTNGIVIRNGASDIRIQNVTCTNTHFHCVFVDNANNVTLENSLVYGITHSASVGAVGNVNGLIIRKNTFHSNVIQGLAITSGSITNAIIEGNTFKLTSGLCMGIGSGTFSVFNNLLHNCDDGIRVLAGAINTRVYANTIADNSGTGLLLDAGVIDTLVTNNIVARNGLQIVDNGASTLFTTNLLTDPGFIAPGSNYRIALATSDAVNQGTDLPEVPTDIDGALRPLGETDIGAYDRAGPPTPPVVAEGLAVGPFSSAFFHLR